MAWKRYRVRGILLLDLQRAHKSPLGLAQWQRQFFRSLHFWCKTQKLMLRMIQCWYYAEKNGTDRVKTLPKKVWICLTVLSSFFSANAKSVSCFLSLGRTFRCSGRRSTGDFQGQKALFYTEACFRLYSAVDPIQPCLIRMTQTSCFNGLVLGVYKGGAEAWWRTQSAPDHWSEHWREKLFYTWDWNLTVSFYTASSASR